MFRILFAALALTGSVGLADEQPKASFECPSESGLTEFRDKLADQAGPLLRAQVQSRGFMTAESKQFFANTLETLDACFPKSRPACLQPLHDLAEQQVSVGAEAQAPQPPIADVVQRQPPKELIEDLDLNTWTFKVKDNAPEIAKRHGWPVVKYKSRHAGGFDGETPSLMMIRVPGDKVNPPVNYDRYLNFALPADSAEHALTPTPQEPFPSTADYLLERVGRKSLPRVFTIVSVERPTEAENGKVFFQLFRRPEASGKREFAPLESTLSFPGIQASGNACIACHPNGLRAISPLGYHTRKLDDGRLEQQLPADEWAAVKEMNEAMEASNGGRAVDWGSVKIAFVNSEGKTVEKTRKFVNPAGVGPVYGPFTPLTTTVTVDAQGRKRVTLPTRTKEFIVGANGTSGCAFSQPTRSVLDIFNPPRPPGRNNIYTMKQGLRVDWNKVKTAMKCAECHNGKARGALNAKTSFNQIEFKVLVDQSMPHGGHRSEPGQPIVDPLNHNERIALVNCLQAEYEQEKTKYEEWLKVDSCEAPAAEPAPAPAPL